jgi:hypothetical protein
MGEMHGRARVVRADAIEREGLRGLLTLTSR